MDMKRKKKIVMFLPNLNKGGAEKISLLILNKLSDQLFEKHLIIFNKIGNNSKNINKNINIINLNNPRLLSNSIKIVKILVSNSYDVVFSSFYHINIFLGFLKFFLNFKLVIRESNDPDQIIKNHPYSIILSFLYGFFYPKADKIILPAKYLKKRFKKFLILNSKMNVIYNPVYGRGLKNIYKKKTYYSAIGRLIYQKGFDNLIKIVNDSSIKRLLIIGSGIEKKNLIKLANSKKIKFISETNPKNYILKSKALIFSSRWEGMPNILLESLMHGTKIISLSRIESVQELKKMVKKNSIYFVKKSNFNKFINKFSNNKNYNNKNLLPREFEIEFAIKKYQRVLY